MKGYRVLTILLASKNKESRDGQLSLHTPETDT